MRVLIAFDKFKDALSAHEACEAAGQALHACRPGCAVDNCPLTDGGEGFVEVLSAAASGQTILVPATGPSGEPVSGPIGWVQLNALPQAALRLLDLPGIGVTPGPDARLAVIGMASVSGLALVPLARRDPWHASSAGTGQLIRAACEAGASAILLGIGGSATNDLGTGALAELGLRFVDRAGAAVVPVTPANWSKIAELQGRPLTLPPIRIACDVTNPLAGPDGATATYGPQKGLKAEDLDLLEDEVTRMAAQLQSHAASHEDLSVMPGAGAAGGMAFGLATALGARLVSGFDLVCAWCDLDARLQAADVVITGEGRFDATSLLGKGPGAIATRAQQLGKPVHVFAGQIQAIATGSLLLHPITPADLPLALALRSARENLDASVRRVFTQP